MCTGCALRTRRAAAVPGGSSNDTVLLPALPTAASAAASDSAAAGARASLASTSPAKGVRVVASKGRGTKLFTDGGG